MFSTSHRKEKQNKNKSKQNKQTNKKPKQKTKQSKTKDQILFLETIFGILTTYRDNFA